MRDLNVPDMIMVEITSCPFSKYDVEQMSPSGSPLEKSHKLAKVSSHPTFSVVEMPS